ncbi:MAG: amino acid adenylation domain-containing protein, partial [Clostridium sp.]|nr:amino acid adenylation domain-containing protein [Clostridium sp.]
MLSVELNEEQAQKYIEQYDNLSIGVINTEDSVVISGETAELEVVKKQFEEAKIKCRYLPVNYAFHYSGIEQYKSELVEKLGKIKAKSTNIKFVSTVTGGDFDSKKLTAEYWANNMRNTVRFADAAKELASFSDIIIEIAPSSALVHYLEQHKAKGVEVVTTQKRRISPVKAMMEAAGELFCAGCDIDWKELNIREGNVIELPAYHFMERPFWAVNDNGQSTKKEEKTSQENRVFSREEIRELTLDIINDVKCINDEVDETTLIEMLDLDSLKMFQINAKINSVFGIVLKIADFTVCVTIRDVIDIIQAYLKEQASDEEEKDQIIERTDGGVTEGQEAIILDQWLNPESNKYNMTGAWKLPDDFAVDKWEQAFNEVVAKYDILNVTFAQAGKNIVQRLSDKKYKAQKITLENEQDIRYYFDTVLNRAFDLENEVIRGILVNQNDSWYFGLAIHHCVIDGVSIFIVFSEITNTYWKLVEGQELSLKKDSAYFQYQDSERNFKHSMKYEKMKQKLKSELKDFYFAKDFRISSATESTRSAEKAIKISGTTFTKLKDYCKTSHFTMFEVLYSIYHLLYYKISNEDAFVTSTYSAGREDVNFYNTVGYLVKILLVASEIDKRQTMKSYIEQIHNKLFSAYGCASGVSVDVINEMAEKDRDGIAHVVVYEKALDNVEGSSIFVNGTEGEEAEKFVLGNVEFEKVKLKCIDSQYNLVFMMEQCQDKIVFRCQYKEAVYTNQAVTKLMTYYVNLLENVLYNPELLIKDYEIVTYEEKQKTLNQQFEGVLAKDLEGIGYHQYLEKYAELIPDKVAAIYGDEKITYEVLNCRSNRLARKIVAYTQGENVPIGIAVDKSIKFLVSIFAVMKAGAYYVPLDKNYPTERLQYIIDNSNMSYVVADGSFDNMNLDFSNVVVLDAEAESCEESHNLGLTMDLNNGAYAIYTSGSTGNPKGVKVTHSGIENVVCEQQRLFVAGPNDKVTFFASVCFDASVFDILMAIGHGATLIFDTRENMGTGSRLHDFLKSNGITITTLPSSVLASMNNEGLDDLRVIVTAGEPCTNDIKNNWCVNHEFFNAYGVTEATIWNTTSKCSLDKKVLIGTAVANNDLLILNQDGNVCPEGVIGELYIGGICLSEGYIGLEEQNREKFVMLDGKRYYRSGDLVRKDYQGEIEYICRADNQLKIRGFRIELEEIEKVIQKQENVINAIVVVAKKENYEQLVCFLETKEKEEAFFVKSVKEKLKNVLPHYMIPDRFCFVEDWVLTHNGKIDRKRMMKEALTIIEQREIVKASTKLEGEVTSLLQNYVGTGEISVTDTLMELGINSIKAYDVLIDIEEKTGVRLKLQEILSDISVRELAQLIGQRDKQELTIFKKPEDVSVTLSAKQKGIWIACLLNKQSREFNIPVVLKLVGDIDKKALDQAFNLIIMRHQILRTRYELEGEEVIGKVEKEYTYEIKAEDISTYDEAEKSKLLKEKIMDMKQANLSPESFPLFFVKLVKVNEKEHYLMFTIHHFIADGWSINILVSEFMKNYQALHLDQPVAWEPLTYQYADIVYSEMKCLQEELAKEREEYWINKLGGEEHVLNLPADYERPVQMTHKGRNVTAHIAGDQYRRFVEFAKSHNTTNFNLMSAILGILLRRYSGQKEIVLGFPILCRENKYEREMIGMFIDTAVVKLDVELESKFSEYLESVSREINQTYEMSKIGLHRIIELINPARMTDSTELFQVLINMIDFNMEVQVFGDLQATVVEDEIQEAKYDFTFYISEEEEKEQFLFKLNYYCDVYSEQTAKMILDSYIQIITRIIEDDSQLVGDYQIVNEPMIRTE